MRAADTPDQGARGHRRRGGVWAQPGYPVFWAAATLGRLADEMFPVAVVLLVLERTGSAALAGATLAAYSFPSVVTGPLLGAWLDRTPRRRLLLTVNRAALIGSLAGILAVAGRGPGWILLGLAVLGGLTAPVLTGGISSLIPLLVPRPLLGSANAWETASYNVAAVGGPALSAAVTAVASSATAVGAQAAVAALALVGVAAPNPMPAAANRGAAGLGAALRDGLAHLLRTPVLRGITATTTVSLAAQGMLPLALPLLVTNLGLPLSVSGWVLSVMEGAGLIGALLVARFRSGWDPARVVLASGLLIAASWALWALAPSVWVVLGLAAAAGLGLGPSMAAMFTVRQDWTPPHLRALIFTGAASLRVGAFAAGAALAGPALSLTGPGGVVALAAVAQVLGVLAGVRLGALHRGRAQLPATPHPGRPSPGPEATG